MKSYQNSFRAQSWLDPIHYDAMLWHSARKTPIHLEQAYIDVRPLSWEGELHLPAVAQANNPELGKDFEETVSWISYLDFNAMYPAAMTLPMPNGPCKTVALPEQGAARLSWLHKTCLFRLDWKSDAEEVSYPCYDFPRRCTTTWTGSLRAHEGEGRKGPVRPAQVTMAEPSASPRPPARSLRPSSAYTLEGVDGRRLKFLTRWRPGFGGLHRVYRFACNPFMAGFMELKHCERRQFKRASRGQEPNFKINDSEGFWPLWRHEKALPEDVGCSLRTPTP